MYRYIEPHELSDLLGCIRTRGWKELSDMTAALVRVGAVADKVLVSELCWRMLASELLEEVVAIHNSLYSLTSKAEKRGKLEIDFPHFYQMLSEACDSLCNGSMDDKTVYRYALFFSFVLALVDWFACPSTEGKDPIFLLDKVTRSQENSQRAARELVKKLVDTMVAQKNWSFVRNISRVFALVANAFWQEADMIHIVLNSYCKVKSLKGRYAVIDVLENNMDPNPKLVDPGRAWCGNTIELLDRLLLSGHTPSTGPVDAGKMNQEASWAKYADVYSRGLAAPIAKDDKNAVKEHCMLLLVMAKCLGLRDGFDLENNNLKSSAQVLSRARKLLVECDEDDETTLTVIAGIEVLMPHMDPTLSKGVAKRRSTVGKKITKKRSAKRKKV